MLPATGNERSVFTFIWTKNKSETSANIDWELRIVGIDEDIAARIQEQVNSVSSLIEEDPAISQDDLEDQQFESTLEQGLKARRPIPAALRRRRRQTPWPRPGSNRNSPNTTKRRAPASWRTRGAYTYVR